MKVSISNGNIKVGKIPSLSLPPIISCRPDVPCHKDCYAMRAYRQYPNVRKAWDGNLTSYKEDPEEFFGYIRVFLAKKQPEFFRWFVSGDVPDPLFWSMIQRTCMRNQQTKFLMFTKRFDLDFKYIPSNCSVILSVWPGMEIPYNIDLPKAWMRPKAPVEGYEIPTEIMECPGHCDVCGACWSLKKTGLDICFSQH